ncbi:hypothetical protein ACEPAG_8258 [Sanghuangporus baumii]
MTISTVLGNETLLHLERFDWESLFYVICWIGTHYSNDVEIKTDALDILDTDVDKLLRILSVCSKQSVLFGLSQPNSGILFTDFYGLLQTLILGDFKVTSNANPEDFDDETLGGYVTWDKFWGILAQ